MLADPRQAKVFRFADCSYDAATGEAQLQYAFDDGPLLIERIVFPHAAKLTPQRDIAFRAALKLLHLIAGVSYYKAGIAQQIRVENGALDEATASFAEEVYVHGLAEFAYQNGLDRIGIDLRERIRFPRSLPPLPLKGRASILRLAHRTLVPIGGGKDSLVSVELLKKASEQATAVWIGDSALIAACAQRTGLPQLNIRRQIAPELFEYNRQGAWNGHIPVTAINSAILLCAAILLDYSAIAFSNESSASSATLEYNGRQVNHQWSKSLVFERRLREYTKSHIAIDLDYFSLLRPYSELAVTRLFARQTRYDDVFSSCNRNFRIRGEKPADRWCGQCPKCHFVFLALAPFMAKPRLLGIFGRNLLDDISLAANFDALLEYRDHKPFECVGEGGESRAALFALTQKPEWREDALVVRFADEILPQIDRSDLALAPLLVPAREHFLPAHLATLLDATD